MEQAGCGWWRRTAIGAFRAGSPQGERLRGARGRGGTLLAHSGGIGAPPGPTTGACQELADGGRRAKSEVVKERLTQKAP